jgi:hypothetical protein
MRYPFQTAATNRFTVHPLIRHFGISVKTAMLQQTANFGNDIWSFITGF